MGLQISVINVKKYDVLNEIFVFIYDNCYGCDEVLCYILVYLENVGEFI